MLFVNNSVIESLIEKSESSPRRREAHQVQQSDYMGPRTILNCMQPDSYARPHIHISNFGETFIAIQGGFCAVIFDNDGNITESHILSPTENKLIDISPNYYHTLISLEKNSIMYEISQGPYNPDSYKNFAPWAPLEEDREAASIYLTELRDKVRGKNERSV